MFQLSPSQGGGHRRLDNSATEPPMMGDYYPDHQGGFTNFQPSLAVVLGVLTVMFSLTFALLIYAKCCHRDAAATATATARRNRLRSSVFSSASIESIRTSGLSKKAIESLPFFRFGTLRGSKDGLECAVCLSKYEDAEILRLLPKCRHAFHIDCVDRWLAANSTCPLCRRNVAAEDASLLNTSSRFVPASSIQEDAEDPNLNPDMNSVDLISNSIVDDGIDVFVEREVEEEGDDDLVGVCRSASIFSIGSSFRRLFAGESGIPVADAGSGGSKALHKHNHKIIVSEVVFKNRWSNVSSSDLMFLKSEMMFSSDRFTASTPSNRDRSAAAARSLGDGEIVQSIKDEIEKKRCLERRVTEFEKRDSNDSLSAPTRALLNPSSSSGSGGGRNSLTAEGRRSMSEITVFSRFRELGWRNNKGWGNPVSDGVSGGGGEEAVEVKKRKKWLPIARKTVEWLASREETQSSGNRQALNFV